LKPKCIKKTADLKGGWVGWRTFVIDKIVTESDEIKSFYLKPKDGNAIATLFPRTIYFC
jgi:nitric oxide dioxygenase